MFLQFFSLILSLILSRFISRFLFCFCPWIYWNFVINFPQLANLVYPFLIHNEMNTANQRDIIIWTCLYSLILISVISISAHMFTSCFYFWPYLLNVSVFSSFFVNIFSITVKVFRNLFWKTCHQFWQILITCLTCPRASFLPSSYSEKMRWGRGCTDAFCSKGRILQ